MSAEGEPGAPGLPEDGLDRIREELRRLGYLDRPLERFLLPRLLSSRLSSLGRIAGVSVRAALIGGPLVGAPVALATRLAGGGEGGWLPFVLLALVLTVAFGGIVFLIELLAGLAVRRGGEVRGARFAAATGVLAAIYLALWWRAHRAAWGSPGWVDGLSLLLIGVLALGLSRLTARAVRIMAAAESLAGGTPPRHRLRAPRRMIGTLIAAVGMAAAALLVFRPPLIPTFSSPSLPIFEPRPIAGRLVVIGVDGLGSRGLEAALRRDLLPRVEALLPRAARRGIDRNGSVDPPVVWTTYATGLPPDRHGVEGVEWHSVAGVPSRSGALVGALVQAVDALLPTPPLARRRPVSSALRRAPALWEILTRKGVSVLVLNWWATSPVPDLPGHYLSDRAFPLLERGEEIAREIAPPAWGTALAREFPAWRARLSLPALESPATVSGLRRALAADAFHAAILERRSAVTPSQASFLYLSSPDIARRLMNPAVAEILDDAEGLLEALALVDRAIGTAAAGLGPDDYLLVILDPGRVADPAGGVFLVAGPGIIPGEGGAPRLDPVQIAPTLLSLAGFPVSSRMGASALDLLEPGKWPSPVPDTVTDFGPPPAPAPGAGAESEGTALENLRSLGYIE